MSKIGCHVSIAGGIWNAPKNASDLGCEVFQMFSRSPRGGSAQVIDKEIAGKFKEEMKKWNQADCYIHAPYYINFASSDLKIRSASVRIVREELERGSLLGVKSLMTHLGSSTSLSGSHTPEQILDIVASGVREVLKDYKGSTEFLLEISAGAGNVIGDTFEELARIIGDTKNVGICLDSAHMFASGYDIKTDAGLDSMVKIIKKTVGIDSIKVIHANDSKVGLGERKDRHDHIGDGKIGIEGFKNLIKLFPRVDLILETKPDKVAGDIKKLKEIRSKI